MRFDDDEPVELDCGCTAYADEDYFRVEIPDVKNGKIIYHKATYCGDNDCSYKAVRDYLEVETVHLETGYDKELTYGDILYDRWKDDGF